MATPFVKWAGGKSKLAPLIESRIEKSIGFENIKHYIEAFVGGGALFFYLVDKYKFETVTLIDINIELINTYKAIKDEPHILMDIMDQMEKSYNSCINEEARSSYFYKVREQFNELDNKDHLKNNIDLKRAAQFIFLNKTCFNGLYRENSKGKYNVPFGKRKEINLYKQSNILEISSILQNVILINGDYTNAREFIQPETLVYFDPPYRPITGTAAFTAYTKNGFNDINQQELADFCREISNSGAYFALSNSDPYNSKSPKLDDFFDDLYQGFEIHRIHAARAIAAKSTSRNAVTEVLIVNEQNFTNEEIENEISLMESGENHMMLYEQYNQFENDDKFKVLMDTLSLTNRTPQYYVNWEKVENNTKQLEISLNTLNYLIGKDNIYEETFNLLSEQPSLIKAIPILLAIRDDRFEVLHVDEELNFDFENLDFKNIDTSNIKKYVDFAKESGLLEFFATKATKSLVDYVFGVEVGLDSNGRKNRSGTFMEKLVEYKLKKICEENNLEYLPQANAVKIKTKWGIEIPYKESMRNHDFAIYNPNTKKLTIIEVNYYGGGGTKLKSVAGEFAELSAYFKVQSPDLQFIWITDGIGWRSAMNPLRDAFESIDYIINLNMLNEGYLDKMLMR